MEYTRGEAAKIIGVSLATLKNYDTWRIVRPKRNKNNYRVYSDEDLEKLREITIFRQLGMEIERDIIPLMIEEHYDREKVLSIQIAKLKDAKREIEKQIRLASLIRVMGPELLSLNDSDRNVRSSVQHALEIMGNPVFDDLFTQLETLPNEEAKLFTATYQSILEQFQTLLKKNVFPDDPQTETVIAALIDTILSLAPLSIRKVIDKSTHALLPYFMAVYSSETYFKKEVDTLYGSDLSAYMYDCFYEKYYDNWLEDSESLLDRSLSVLFDSSNDTLPDSIVDEWITVLMDYLGPFNPAFIKTDKYLSILKDLLIDGYEKSDLFNQYLDRLFAILATKIKSTEGEPYFTVNLLWEEIL